MEDAKTIKAEAKQVLSSAEMTYERAVATAIHRYNAAVDSVQREYDKAKALKQKAAKLLADCDDAKQESSLSNSELLRQYDVLAFD
ncbi:MAG: hypothetical protein LBQ50_03635 [Planctomycetaceae bacterium]|nr:hypothetical protein [Planctomycetaceae bacterium]